MRYATFSTESNPLPRLGIVQGDRIIEAAGLAGSSWNGAAPDTLLKLIQQGPEAWQRLRELASKAPAGGASVAIGEIQWHAPIPRPTKNIICLGLNYAAHIKEGAAARGRDAKIPSAPVFFSKSPTTVIGPYADVLVDRSLTQQVDWEAELGAIIGIGGRKITKGDALRHVFGYTVINDVTARDLQSKHLQWFKGKSLDTFCPMGPVVVTPDEFGDPQQKRVQLRVNGVTKQDGNSADMIFPIDVIIETWSNGVTLEAGDIISTGTPEGVGLGRTPQEFLNNGDTVETEVEGIGILRNRVTDMAG